MPRFARNIHFGDCEPLSISHGPRGNTSIIVGLYEETWSLFFKDDAHVRAFARRLLEITDPASDLMTLSPADVVALSENGGGA